MNQIELNKYWAEISDKLSSEITTVAYIIYFTTLEPFTVNGDTLVLSTDLNSHKDAINTTYREKFLNVLKEGNYPFKDFIVILKDEKESYQSLEEDVVDKLDDTLPFIKEYTFDTFVVGDSNRMAYMAFKCIAENLGEDYNPIFIYSHVGLGKTHLMNAVGNYLKEKSPSTKVIYITAENFTNDYVYAIRNTKNAEYIKQFNDRYRNTDVLMIDDVQFLEKTERTQELLFHIFNDLYAKNKQIIISSDRPIKNLSLIDERLTSRFQSGFSVEIGYPSIEDRMAILHKKCADWNFNIDPSILYYLAVLERNNIRVLQGMLRTVGLHGKLLNKPVTDIQMVKDALNDRANTNEEKITMQTITEATATYFNVKTSDILYDKSRSKKLVLPRQYAMYLITVLLPDIPLATIGEFFSRDHSTVINSRDKIGKLKDSDEKTKTIIEDIKNMIYNQ